MHCAGFQGFWQSLQCCAFDLSLETKRQVYFSVVLGVLLHGAETWAPTQVLVRKLEWFHRRCVGCIMGVGRAVQWAQHITTAQLAECFGRKSSLAISLVRVGFDDWVLWLECLTTTLQNACCLVGFLRNVPLMVSSFIGGIRLSRI